MVQLVPRSMLAAAALLATTAHASSVSIKNLCTYQINLYDNSAVTPLAPGADTYRALANGFVGMFRHGTSDQATLGEISVDAGTGRPWYDISIIPPGPGNCGSFGACKAVTGKVGFNVPMQIAPQSNEGIATCRTLTCMADGCDDAYLYPADDTKTHNCPSGTNFVLTFCPGGTGGATPAPTTPAPTTPAPTTPAPTTTAPPPTETPSPSPAVLLAAVGGSNNGSVAGEEDAGNLPAPVAENEDAVADFGATTPAPTTETSAPVVVAAPTTDEGTVRANTQSSQSESDSTGLVVALIVGAVAMTAGAVIVVIRKKKRALEALDQKSPMPTPANGDNALAAFRANDVSQL